MSIVGWFVGLRAKRLQISRNTDNYFGFFEFIAMHNINGYIHLLWLENTHLITLWYWSNKRNFQSPCPGFVLLKNYNRSWIFRTISWVSWMKCHCIVINLQPFEKNTRTLTSISVFESTLLQYRCRTGLLLVSLLVKFSVLSDSLHLHVRCACRRFSYKATRKYKPHQDWVLDFE